eukprot:65246_1
MSDWSDSTCYYSHASTPYYVLILGMITSLFINCYMFFSGQTLASRLWMYTKYLCCFCFYNGNKFEPPQRVSSYPLIIQIASTNTRDAQILDVCGYYRRTEQLSENVYLYSSTFKSYIQQCIFILHYSVPPTVVVTRLNTISFSPTTKPIDSKRSSSITGREHQWMLTAVNLSTVPDYPNNAGPPIASDDISDVYGSAGTFGQTTTNDNMSVMPTTLGSIGKFFAHHCSVIAIQNIGYRRSGSPEPYRRDYDLDDRISNYTTIGNTPSSIKLRARLDCPFSPVQSLLSKRSQLWIFESMNDVDTDSKYVLRITKGTLYYFTSNILVWFMMILALYQIYVDGAKLFQYAIYDNEHKTVSAIGFYNYQCYAVIVANSPNFKQIFLIFAVLIMGRTNAAIYVKHLIASRKILGILYLVYLMLYFPVLLTHTVPFMVIYAMPLVILIGCLVYRLLKIERNGNLMLLRQNEKIKDDIMFWSIWFLLIVLFYILSILSISTMVRLYDGTGFFECVWDAMWERNTSAYFDEHFALVEIDKLIETVYRFI